MSERDLRLAPNAPALPSWFKWVFRSSGPPVDVDVVIDGDGDGDGDGDDRSNYPEEQPIRGHAQLPKAGRLPVLSSVRRPCGRLQLRFQGTTALERSTATGCLLSTPQHRRSGRQSIRSRRSAPLRDRQGLGDGMCCGPRRCPVPWGAGRRQIPSRDGVACSHRRNADQTLPVTLVAVAVAVNDHVNDHVIGRERKTHLNQKGHAGAFGASTSVRLAKPHVACPVGDVRTILRRCRIARGG